MPDVQAPEPSSSPDIEDGPQENPSLNGRHQPSPIRPSSGDEQLKAQLERVTLSDVGLSTLLGRLKQSIASARDFSTFLKKRSIIEQEQAESLKKLVRATHDSIRRPEHRQGSYAQAYENVTKIQDSMAEHGLQFARSLHQMSDDLQELGSTIERGRKHWKQIGTNAEKRVLDAENAMDKAKAKYDSLAEQYDRARTGDRQSGRFGLKGPKSAAQVEEDLHKKLEAADADYQGKVQAAQSQRQELIGTLRPQFTKALQDLTTECDSGLTLQMQKFATFNEKLLLANGLIVSPLKNQADGDAGQQRSLRDVIHSVDNASDFNRYILGFTNQSNPRIGEIKYEQHPTLRSAKQMPTPAPPPQPIITQPTPQASRDDQLPFSPGNGPPQTEYKPSALSSGPPQLGQISGITNSFQGPPSAREQYPSSPQPSPYGPPPGQMRDQYQQQPSPSYAPQHQQSSPMLPKLPSQEPLTISGAMDMVPNGPVAQNVPNGHHSRPSSGQHLPPSNPVFGVSLDDLFLRDGSAVPIIVYQCCQAVDMFGLEVEGIYRTSGSNPHIMELKQMFDHDSTSVDFRDPQSFHHDISSVAGLIKLFFRSLPSPLLTTQHYSEFISAAQIPDDILRRDSLHAIVNALPDTNYATLRVLVLHLHRVHQQSSVNRMTAQNLAIVWGPTLMGGDGGIGDIRDAGWQARVVETILVNTFQIFDDDE